MTVATHSIFPGFSFPSFRLSRRGAALVEHAFATFSMALLAVGLTSQLAPGITEIYDRQEAAMSTTHAPSPSSRPDQPGQPGQPDEVSPVPPTVPLCTDCQVFSETDLSSLGPDSGTARISADGTSITLSGDAWKAAPFSHVIKKDTVLSFDIWATDIADIQAIALQKKNPSPDESRSFRILGVEEWGISDYHRAEGAPGASIHVDIPVGQHYRGRVWQIVLIAEGQDRSGSTTTFSNIEIR